MITPTFREKIYLAIQEYNTAIIRPSNEKVTSYDARRGMLYTTLRRVVPMGTGRGRLEPSNFRCVFCDNGELEHLKVVGVDFKNHWDTNWTDIMMLEELCTQKKEFYKESLMNEIVDIVNSIK